MVHLLAIVTATVITYLIGGLWYSRRMFGDQWAKLTGVKMPKPGEKMPPMGKEIIGTALSLLILNVVLATVIESTGTAGAGPGAAVGLWLWIGFVATTHLYSVFYAKKSTKLYAIDTGYVLIGMLISGAIIGSW